MRSANYDSQASAMQRWDACFYWDWDHLGDADDYQPVLSIVEGCNQLVHPSLMMTDSTSHNKRPFKLGHNNGRLRLLIIPPFVGTDQIYEIDCGAPQELWSEATYFPANHS